MTKILIIPDLHGRGFWKEPCNNWTGKIVFLGDYHDPYGEYVDEEPDKAESLINLKELAVFIEEKRKFIAQHINCNIIVVWKFLTILFN